MNLFKDLKSLFASKQRSADLDWQRAYSIPGISHYVGIATPIFALKNPTVYGCAKLIVDAIGTMSINLVDIDTQEKVTDHSASKLLKTPNSRQSRTVFMKQMVYNYTLFGNAFAEKTIERGQVTELYPLPAQSVNPLVDKNGNISYDFLPLGSSIINLQQSYVTHWRGFGEDELNPLKSMSPLWAAANAISLAMTQEKMATELYANRMQDLIIKLPPEAVTSRLKEIEEAGDLLAERKALQNRLEDTASKRALFLPFGFESEQYTTNLKDVEFQAIRDYQTAEIARIFNVPLFKLGVLSSVAGATSAEMQELAFYNTTLRPIIETIEDQLAFDLLSEADRQRYEFKFDTTELLRGDVDSRTTYVVRMTSAGLMTSNEARKLEGLPKSDQDGADELRFPVNQTSEVISGADQPTNPADNGTGNGTAEHKRSILDGVPSLRQRSLERRAASAKRSVAPLRSSIEKVQRKERNDIIKDAGMLKQNGKTRANLIDRINTQYSTSGDLRTYFTKTVKAPIEAIRHDVTNSVQQTHDVQPDDAFKSKQTDKYSEILAEQYSAISKAQLTNAVEAADSDDYDVVVKSLQKQFDEWDFDEESGESRADRVARNEVNRASNVFFKGLMKLAGVLFLYVIVNSPCEFCADFQGTKYSVNNPPDLPAHKDCSCQLSD